MRKYVFALICLLSFVAGLYSSGECQSFDADKIEIVSIKSMQIRKENSNHFMDIVINMRNTNESTIKLKDNDFAFALSANDETGVKLGNAKPADIILESAIETKNTINEVTFSVNMGADVGEGFRKLSYVVNSIGNPVNNMKISLDGSCVIGTKSEKGWVYMSGYRIEFVFSPKIQREILFE